VIALVLTLLASPPNDAALLVSRRTGLSIAEANALAQEVSVALLGSDVPLRWDANGTRDALARLSTKDTASCNGRRACVTELGRQVGVPFVIALSASRLGDDLSVALELIGVNDGVTLENDALVVSGQLHPSAAQLRSFTSKVKARLAPAPVADAPTLPVVVATPSVDPQVVLASPSVATLDTRSGAPRAERGRVVPFVLGGAAVAAAGAGVALLVAGLNTRAEAYRTESVGGELRSPYPASEVTRRAAAGAVDLGVAGGLAALALGLGVGAAVTW
jgi:hypothetical protein